MAQEDLTTAYNPAYPLPQTKHDWHQPYFKMQVLSTNSAFLRNESNVYGTKLNTHQYTSNLEDVLVFQRLYHANTIWSKHILAGICLYSYKCKSCLYRALTTGVSQGTAHTAAGLLWEQLMHLFSNYFTTTKETCLFKTQRKKRHLKIFSRM